MGRTSEHVVAPDGFGPGSLQRAVNSLGDAGGTVELAPGVYDVDATIRVPSGVTIAGPGPSRTSIVLAPHSSCHVFTNADHAKGDRDIVLRGFHIDGNLREQPKPADLQGITFACGGYFKRVESLTVQDVAACGIRQTAFHFNHCDHVVLERLVADELGWSGVSTSGTDDIVLRAVVVTRSGLDVRHSGIHLDGGAGALVDAVVDTSTGNGIMIDSKFSPMSDVVVHGTVRGCMRGVSLSGDHENPLTNVLVSVQASDNRECGLLVSNASNAFVVDSTFTGNGPAGIVLQGRAGSPHCVIARCSITGSPTPVLERDGTRVAYITESHLIEARSEAPMLEEAAGQVGAAPAPNRSSRLRGRVARAARRVRPPAAPTTDTAGGPAPPSPDVTIDAYDGTCSVCGEAQRFERANPSLREGYRCRACKASLRYRGQAEVLVQTYARQGAITLRQLVEEPEFASLSIWEPGVLGPLRQHLSAIDGYVMSDFWPDVAPGDERDGIRCEDLMALTFEDRSFDLVITSDIFEHVRRPIEGFAEVRRVLREGGRHIFSIPIQEPWRAATQVRVDTTGDDDVHLLEPRYHLGPGNSQHLVYNDFGRDLLEQLEQAGFESEAIRHAAPSAEASRLLTLRCTRR